MDKRYYTQEVICADRDIWHHVLNHALASADTVEFVVPKNITKWSADLLNLLPYFESTHTSRWRWQYKQWSASTFMRFKLTAEVRAYLQSVERLEEWVFQRPEDPTLYQGDRAILWTISHEAMLFALLTEEEALMMNQKGCELTPIDDLSPPTKRAGHT